MELKHTTLIGAQVKAIPKHRLIGKLSRSAFGLLFMAGAAYMAVKLATPWYVYLPVGFFGAHIVSAELTQKGMAFVVAILKDLLGAVKPKTPE